MKIYLDSSANIKFIDSDLKKNHSFFTFLYDNSCHKRKNVQNANPSNLQWRDLNMSWAESQWTWGDLVGSDIYEKIRTLVGSSHRRDVLHVDSAHKTKVDIFLTEDTDIISVRDGLEKICRFKIFNTGDYVEQQELLNILKQTF